jgi:hypothetical protein
VDKTGNAVAHEHQADGSTSRGRGTKADPRKELRGTECWEAIMASVIAVAAVALFIGGFVVGVLGVVAREIRREDRLYSLAEDAPNPMSRGARRLTGFGRRDLDVRALAAGRRAAA